MFRNVPNGLSVIKQSASREHYVDFFVAELTETIKELLDDIQNMFKVTCIVTNIKEGLIHIRFC
ncbi:MAG: hypothetical protein IKT40_11975 [Bacilli bacterium]|nr:hypothetical protein [Bacilli bacterium]